MTYGNTLAVISSLAAGELARLRRCSGRAVALDGIALHPRERESCAAAVAEMFSLQATALSGGLADWAQTVYASQRQTGGKFLTFLTSGSTGEPKRCMHRVGDLEREVEIHLTYLPRCKRVLALVPRHHMYGFLWTVMLPERLGVEAVELRGESFRHLERQFRRGDLVVGVPFQWQRISEISATFPDGITAITSGEACPAALVRRLSEQGLHVVDIYGCTETAGVGYRRAPHVAFELLPCWSRFNDSVSSTLLREDGRSVRIPDRLEWLNERHFFVCERADAAVQVHGMNVYPAGIAEHIREHPAVQDCAVRRMRPDEGDRLKAYVVPHRGAATEEIEIWIQATLRPYERPAHVLFGPTLPQTESGKRADWDCGR